MKLRDPLTRRQFVAAAVISPLIAAQANAAGRAPEAPCDAASTQALIGRSEGSGIAASTVACETWSAPRVAYADAAAPSYLVAAKQWPLIYAVSEGNDADSRVLILRSRPDGTLEQVGAAATGSGGPCYVSVHASRPALVTANYGGGSLSFFRLTAAGMISGAPEVWRNTVPASHVVADRQEASHMHCANYSPDGSLLVAADLGTDELLLFSLDTHGMPTLPPSQLPMRPGSGPRHVAFHPSGRWLYCIHELDSTVDIVDLHGHGPEARLVMRAGSVVNTASTPHPAGATAAEIVLRGHRLYTSTRGVNQLAAFHVRNDGALELMAYTPAAVDKPRFFCLHERELLCCGELSNDIVSFTLDARGLPTAPRTVLRTPKPSCIVFVAERT